MNVWGPWIGRTAGRGGLCDRCGRDVYGATCGWCEMRDEILRLQAALLTTGLYLMDAADQYDELFQAYDEVFQAHVGGGQVMSSRCEAAEQIAEKGREVLVVMGLGDWLEDSDSAAS